MARGSGLAKWDAAQEEIYQDSGMDVVSAGAVGLHQVPDAAQREYFSARCWGVVTSQIHSLELSLSFSCASGYKEGNLPTTPARDRKHPQPDRTEQLVAGGGATDCHTYNPAAAAPLGG